MIKSSTKHLTNCESAAKAYSALLKVTPGSGLSQKGSKPPELAEVLNTPYVEIEHQGYDVDVSPSRRARAQE